MDFSGFTVGASCSHGEVDHSLYGMLEAEGARYASFFTTLEQAAPQRISRSTATAFFAKSSLSDAEVEALYVAIKSVGLVPDPSVLSETEFILGMHMIVCMTKRGLTTLPSPFPTYLFPSLNLPAAGGGSASSSGRGSFGFASPSPPPSAFSGAHADLISSMPSPEKPSGVGGSVGMLSMARSSFSSVGNSEVSTATMTMSGPPPTEIIKLHDATSIIDLAHKEVQNNSLLQTQLGKIDASEEKTLEHLQATLEALAVAVEQLGFPVPPSARASIGALDDLGNLLRASVQSVKQEIQSLEISAQMRSVADEATSRTNSSNNSGSLQSDTIPRPSDAVATVTSLTQQLAALQAEAKQLQTKKDTLARQVMETKKTPTKTESVVATSTASVKTVSGSAAPLTGSSSWGDFGASAGSVGSASAAAVAPLAPPQDSVRATENTTAGFASSTTFTSPVTPSLDASAFGFGSAFAADGGATVPVATADAHQQPQDSDFGGGWGAFQ